MELVLQPVLVASGEEGEGRLVFHQERLVGILVQLSPLHGDSAGRWFLEVGFGRLESPEPPAFPDLEAARSWISARLADNRRGP